MTYINGSYGSAPANVAMVESDTFCHKLLHVEALRDISADEELLFYGATFELPRSPLPRRGIESGFALAGQRIQNRKGVNKRNTDSQSPNIRARLRKRTRY